MDLITLLLIVVYVALAAHAGLRARRTGQPALRRLGWFLLVIAVVIGSAPLFSAGLEWLGILALMGGISLYPALLLRFGAALGADSRLLERLAVAVLVVTAVSLATSMVLLGDLEAAVVWTLGIGAVAGIVAHVVVLEVLRRQVTTMASSFVRRRAVTLGAGLALIGVSLGVGVFGLAVAEFAPLVALIGGAVAAGLLSAATVPPRWLQTALAQTDHDALLVAEEALTTSPDVQDAVTDLLAAVLVLLVGRSAWLTDGGEVVAEVGVSRSAFPAAVTDGSDGTIHRVAGPDGAPLWLLRAESMSCRLTVVTGRDPVLFGLDVADLLPRLTRRVAIALEGRELEQRRRAQTRAEQQAEHYRLVAEMKDDLLSTINHELRTPLSLVAGGLELLTARWDDATDEQRRLLVERANANAQGLLEVVLEVLSLVELRSGVTDVQPAPTRMTAVAEEALAGLDGDGRIEVECAAVEAVFDRALTARVLRQLVDNALRHTDGPVAVTLGVADGHVEVRVADRGPGVGEELLGPFQRGGNYLHRTTRGLGVGLSLVTETVDLLRGQVRFDHDGSGTTVVARLPHEGAVVDAHVDGAPVAVDGAAATAERTSPRRPPCVAG